MTTLDETFSLIINLVVTWKRKERMKEVGHRKMEIDSSTPSRFSVFVSLHG